MKPPEISEISMRFFYRAAGQTGGDWYGLTSPTLVDNPNSRLGVDTYGTILPIALGHQGFGRGLEKPF
jgi:hypothetical protein